MNADDFVDYWSLALEDSDRVWPEDVLSDAEWEAGWLDRRIIAGRATEADRAATPRELGGAQ